MTEGFKGWTPKMVLEHNLRVLEQRRIKRHGQDKDRSPQPQPDQPEPDVRKQPLGPVAETQAPAAPVHSSAPPVADGGQGQGALDQLPQTGRYAILITDYRVRLLDEDNLYGGAKSTCDCLRYARFLADDRPQDMKLYVRQWKVEDPKEVRTEIELTPIADNWTDEALFKLNDLMTRILANDVNAVAELMEMMP